LEILFLLVLIPFGISTYGQYLCDNEYRVINKQKKIIRKKAKKIANVWILTNADSLNIPEDIKLSKLKFLPKKIDKWYSIDSLLCVKKNKELIEKAQLVSAKLRKKF